MIRSNWTKSIIVALASTGLTWGQQPESPTSGPGMPVEQEIITVKEDGKPPQKCRVIKIIHLANGVEQQQVQDLRTGQVMTITNSSSPIAAPSMPTVSAPPLAPAGSLPAASPTAPVTHVLPSATPGKGTEPSVETERIMTVRETDHSPQKCRVVKTWRMADGMHAYQVQSIESGETLTVVETGAPASASGDTQVRTMSTRIFHWGKSITPPPGVPVPPGTAVVQAAPPAAPPSPPHTQQNTVSASPSTGTQFWPPAHNATLPDMPASSSTKVTSTPPGASSGKTTGNSSDGKQPAAAAPIPPRPPTPTIGAC